MKFQIVILIIIFHSSLLNSQNNSKDSISIYNHYQTGIEYERSYIYDTAALYFEEAASLYENQKMWVECVKSLNRSIKMRYKEQQIDNALQNIEKGFSIANKYFSNTNADELNEMVNLVRFKGVLYKNFSNHDKALLYFNKSSEYNLKLKKLDSLNYLINESKLLYGISIIYMLDRNKDLALSYLKKSLNIQKSLPFDPDFNLSIIYLNIGSVYKDYMDLESATQFYMKAKESNNNKYNNFQLIDSYINNQIGKILFDQERYIESLDYLQKSLYRKTKLFGSDHVNVADGNSAVAMAYLKNGNFDKAINHVNNALRTYIKLYGINASEVADAYLKLGELYYSKHEYITTNQYLNLALKIQTELFGEKHYLIAKTYNKLGDVYSKLNNQNEAINYYQQAIIANVIGFNDRNFLNNPDLDLKVFTNTDLLRSLQKKAEVLNMLYKTNKNKTENIISAFKTYKLSFELSNMIRQDHKSEEAKMIIGENNKPIYYKALDVAYEINDLSEDIDMSDVFDFMEAARNSTLYSMIHELEASRYSGIPESLLNKNNDLKKDLTYFKTQIEKSKLLSIEKDTAIIRQYEKRYFELFVKQDSIIGKIKEKYTTFNKKNSVAKLVSVEELQKELDSNVALIEYFTGDTSIYISIVTHEKYHIKKISIDSSLKDQTIKYYKTISKWGSKRLIANLSHKLYDKLIRPFEDLIVGKEKLIIIPDEYLFYIPFETLCRSTISEDEEILFSKLPYLIRDFDISYYFSATLWLKGKKKSNQNLMRKNQLNTFCAFAPVFTDDNHDILRPFSFLSDSTNRYVWRSITVDGKKFRPLPYTKKEVDTLTQLFQQKGMKAESFLFKEANEKNFKSTIKDFQFIHIATHGFSNNNDPNLSGLLFSQETNNSNNNKTYTINDIHNEDGILYSAEMYNLNINADLVVLSACETGIGKLRIGEGLIAMTRGFIYAGVPNTIFTLWKVSDSHTHGLMITLYEEILKGNSYSKSLQVAKLKMIHNETTAFPILWSGFLLIGQ